jgi:hypothetical protein
VVVYFHPAVGMALQERVQDRSEAGFERVGVVLDAEDLPGWDAVTADLLWVADEGTSKELREKNPRVAEVVAGGWPVRPSFFPTEEIKGSRKSGAVVKILYLVNSRRRKASRTLEKLLEIKGVEVTAVVGREEGLKADLQKGLAEAKCQGVVHGWVKDLATMIRAHDLVVTKPGTISVREVLARADLPFWWKEAKEQKSEREFVVWRRGSAAGLWPILLGRSPQESRMHWKGVE